MLPRGTIGILQLSQPEKDQMSTQPHVLLPGESLILSSESDELILTNFRVKFESIARSSSKYQSIPIGKVASCALSTRSYPVLLLLAVVAGLAIFGMPQTGQRVMAGIAAAILVALYFVLRNGQIQIFSDGGESIAVPTKGLSHEQVKKFLEAVANQHEITSSRN
jgi:hypothetical protein